MIVVALTTAKDAAATPAKVTDVAPVKLVPEIVTDVPPAVDPLLGETPVTVAGAAKVNANVFELPPATVETATVVAPAAQAGVVARMAVELTSVTLEAFAHPMVTVGVPLKPEPLILTC